MSQTFKVIVSVVAVVLIASLGYFFIGQKSDIASPPLNQKPTANITANITFEETGSGCGFDTITVYKLNDDNTSGISVHAKKDVLNLTTAEQSFAIGKTDGLDVEILTADSGKIPPYCADIVYPNQLKPRKLIGKSGIATISISDINESQPDWDGNYTTTVILKDVRFAEENGNSSDITIDSLIFKDVRVGWLPG